jgi:hypothetical protein
MVSLIKIITMKTFLCLYLTPFGEVALSVVAIILVMCIIIKILFVLGKCFSQKEENIDK